MKALARELTRMASDLLGGALNVIAFVLFVVPVILVAAAVGVSLFTAVPAGFWWAFGGLACLSLFVAFLVAIRPAESDANSTADLPTRTPEALSEMRQARPHQDVHRH